MRFSTRQLVSLIGGAVLLSYVFLIATQIDQQSVPDFGAFYAVAKALGAGGLTAAHHMYSLKFQLQAGAFLSHGAKRAYVEPFVALPPAAWVVVPFTILSLWPAFILWDGLCLLLCIFGTFWLARQEKLGRDAIPLALAILASYPIYTALGEGQYDLLWPLCLALFTAAWTCSSSFQRWTRTAAAAVIFTFKPDLLLLLVVPAVAAWRRRTVQVAAACLVALAAITVAVVSIPGMLLLPKIESYTLFTRFPPTLDETVLGFLWRLTGRNHLSEDLAFLAIGVALLLLAWVWWRDPPKSERDWKLALTSTICLSVVVAPHALNHDFILLAGPVVWTAGALRSSGRDLRWLAFWIILFNVTSLLDDTPRVTFPVPLVPIVLVAAAVAAWRARRTLADAPSVALEPATVLPPTAS
ncbi:MAG TPA: glycosyltransferase 87 family protein [Candidatus Dormibacteraeota bacterium]|nr:glycosyltransferase 87 family protein [Candidatus Dormibacteraeota bacterium]